MPAVLEYFKATGPGWQTRIDEVSKKSGPKVTRLKSGESETAIEIPNRAGDEDEMSALG